MKSQAYLTQRVFIIDDDPMMAGLYEQAVSNLGFTDITLFHDGLECVNALIQEPKIIFLDQNMDNISGLEVLRKIKRFDPNIYVVFVSGQEDIHTAVTSLKYGAFDYIVKGDQDIENIEKVLQKIHNVQELLKRNNTNLFKKVLSVLV